MEDSVGPGLGSASGRPNRFDITIAGEINLDLILYGLSREMPTEKELLASDFQMTLGSSSAIVAHNLALLGSRVGFTCLAGQDRLGRIALDRLADSGVDISTTRYSERATGVTVLLPHGTERHILTYPGTMANLRMEHLDLPYLCSGRHFHLSSLFLQKGLQPDIPELLRVLKAAGLTLSLDTNDDPEDVWGSPLDEVIALVDVLMPNERELLRITRAPNLHEALDAMTDRVPLLIVKCGHRGAVVQQGTQRTLIAPLQVEPVDTIGAGDSFNAGFLHAWTRGTNPVSAGRFGNLWGAYSTQRAGGTEAFREPALMAEFYSKHSAYLELQNAAQL